ncbi:MAG: hypothetical protein IT327_21525 [Anaerolineae bacterium]|nr:hypothetical protein [Anaerolineae bacterium]
MGCVSGGWTKRWNGRKRPFQRNLPEGTAVCAKDVSWLCAPVDWAEPVERLH